MLTEAICLASIREARDGWERGELRAGLARCHGERAEHAFRDWNDVWLQPDFVDWNIEHHLLGIRVPVLVIQGEDDQYGTIRQVEAIEAGATSPVPRLLFPDSSEMYSDPLLSVSWRVRG